MAQDGVAFIAALKQVWLDPNTIEEQLYEKNPVLELFERVTPMKEIGSGAVVAVHTARNGGYTAVPKTGSNALNAAGAQGVKQAEYLYTHHWYQIELESAVIDESSGNDLAVASAANFEMEGALNDLKRQLTRQAVATTGALIGQFEANAATTTLTLNPAFNQILKRELVWPGLLVQIGTATEQEVVAGSREILEVIPSETVPKIKISGANVTTTTSHFLSIQGARSGETSYEMNGLPYIISETTKLGNINPATQNIWKANVDTTTTTLTLEALMERQDRVYEVSGLEADTILASPKQYRNYYLELDNQVRYAGDGGLQAGNSQSLQLGVNKVIKDRDILDNNVFFVRKEDLCAVRADPGPEWADRKYGKINPVQYVPGTTKVKGAIVYRLQLGVTRRNTHAAFTALT